VRKDCEKTSLFKASFSELKLEGGWGNLRFAQFFSRQMVNE
jgi:hypothetical protein